MKELEKSHGEEVESLNITLRSLKDKYAILKEEVDLQKVSLFDSVSTFLIFP